MENGIALMQQVCIWEYTLYKVAVYLNASQLGGATREQVKLNTVQTTPNKNISSMD